MVGNGFFRISIRSLLCMLAIITAVVWGGYVYWDSQVEAAAERYMKLVEWKTPEEFNRLQEETLALNPTVEKRVLKKLKEKYPLVSLVDRLKYEKKWGRDSLTKNSKIDTGTELDLEELPRLKHLHENGVKDFVMSSGFGVGRMEVIPTFRSVDFFGDSSKSRSMDRFDKSVLGLWSAPDSKDILPTNVEAKRDVQSTMASEYAYLNNSHQAITSQFAFLSDMVYVRSLREVAGFESHKIRVQDWNFGDNAKENESSQLYIQNIGAYWGKHPSGHKIAVSRVDLVSLLVHQKPQVYMTDQLPDMDELDSTKVRDLHPFEKESLKKIQSGKDLVAKAKGDTILMFGAIRASRQCLQCHSGDTGDLLGAFSYVLKVGPKVSNLDTEEAEDQKK